MIRINLIRDAQPEIAASSGSAWMPAFALLGVLIVHLALGAWLTAITERRDGLRLEIARERAEARRKQAATNRATAEDVAAPGPASSAIRLRSVAVAVPPDLWLTGYRELRGEVTLRGVASADEAARVFVENLAAAASFRRVEITETARAPSGPERRGDSALLEFRMTALFDEGGLAIDTEEDEG